MATKRQTHEEYQRQFMTPAKPKGKSPEEKMRDDKAKRRQTQEDDAIKMKERQDATTPRGKTLSELIRSRNEAIKDKSRTR